MRRTTGAILIETRPERMSRSAWRGEARNASKPKRAMSTRAATIDIISIAQQARPKVAGNIELPRAQSTALSSVVVMHALLDVLLEVGALEVAAQHVARAQLARRGSRRWAWPAPELLAADYSPFERSPAPDVDEGDHQQRDEDDRLDQREGAERPQLRRRPGRGR